MMKNLIIVWGAMVLISGPCLAQEQNNIMTATSALQDVLSNLKDSVQKLSVDNDQLAFKDNLIKQQVGQLQAQLVLLQNQGNLLNDSIEKLQVKDPDRAERITQLEGENFDLDNQTQKAEAQIKLIQESMDAGFHEDQQLLLQLKKLQNVIPSPLPLQAVETPSDHQEKEKLKLMKMIYESQQRQVDLHKAIFELQKNTPIMPGAEALAHQQYLKEQIKDIQDQLALAPTEKTSSDDGNSRWDSTQIAQMENELKYLEENYNQLKNLMNQMNQKAQSVRMTVAEHVEEVKLQNSIDELNRQSLGLRANLDELRNQLIDLDKRKSSLEAMVQHLT